MKNRYAAAFLSIAFLAAARPAAAQNPRWSWARRDGNVTYSINPAYPRQVVAATPSRILWGTIHNQRQLLNTMLGDYLIQELDTAGVQQASVAVNGKVTFLQAKADTAGNWYLLGILSDSMKVGSAPLIRQPGGGLGPERFLLRLHAGTLAQDWMTMVGNDVFCTTETFTLDGNGIYLSIDSALSSAVTRYDLNTGQRQKLINQNTRSAIMGIARDDFGQTTLLGTCLNDSKMDFNGTSVPVPADLSYPWYIVNYGANGQYRWHHFLRDITCTERGLSRIGSGGVVLSGDLYDTTTLAGRHLAKAAGEDNYVVARLENDGTIRWAVQRPVTSVSQGQVSFGGAARSLTTDSMLITTPESKGPSVWGSGGIATNNASLGGTVVAYGMQAGAALWAKGIDADYSNIQGVASDGSAVYIAGVASDLNSIDFDQVSIPMTGVSWKYVPYIAKLNLRSPALKAEPTSLAYGLYVWPNPATDRLELHSSDRGDLRVLDVRGRRIWTGRPDWKGDASIDVSGWARGMYFVQQAAFGAGGVIKVVLR